MHTVHVRVNDAATGKPTPCRVRFTDAEGRYYAPFGRLTKFSTGRGKDVGGNVLLDGKQYAYIDGACEIQLPAGRITVEIHKGFEYSPILEEINLAPGKLALRFKLERWTDSRQAGWYSGDADAYWLSPHAALLEGAAEDLALVNLLAEETFLSGEGVDNSWKKGLSNILAFSGQQPSLQRPDCMVVVNTANEHYVLGRLSLLNCHRPVYPLRFGDDEETGRENWTLADWCDQCHRKGGLVVAQKFCGNVLLDATEGSRWGGGETLAEMILGKIDAMDVFPVDPYLVQDPLQEWRSLLNAGFRIPLAAGSGKRDNLGLLGRDRTYARLNAGQEWSYKNWVEAVRAGRTFVTSGPILAFTVNGQEPGAALDLPSGSASVHVRAEARCLRPMERLEVIANGAVVASAEPTGERPSHAALEADVSLSHSGWLAARAFCPRGHNELQRIYAHSSAVYVRLDGKPPQADPAEIAPFLAKLDAMLQWVAEEARYDNDAQRQRLANIFQAARQELLRRSSRGEHDWKMES